MRKVTRLDRLKHKSYLRNGARFFALFLVVCLASPSPTFAMRSQGPDDPNGPVRTGLEELLKGKKPATDQIQVVQQHNQRTSFPLGMSTVVHDIGLEEGHGVLFSGRELTASQHRIVNEAIKELFGKGKGREAEESLYRQLDPEGSLRALGARIWLLEGLNRGIQELARKSGSFFRDRLITHPGTNQTQGREKHLYLDAQDAQRLSTLAENRRKEWARHEALHLTQPSLSEAEVQRQAPIDDLLADLQRIRVEEQLPMVIKDALGASQQQVPDADKRYMLQLVQKGKRSGGEIAAAVSSALKLEMTPGELLRSAERYSLPVPMTVELVELSKINKTGLGHVGRWMLQVFAAERSAGPEDQGRVQAWKAASIEVKEEVIQTTGELIEHWKELHRSYEGSDQVPFSQVLDLYDAIRSVPETEEALGALFEMPLTPREARGKYPYYARLLHLLGKIQEAGGYRSHLLEMFEWDPKDYGDYEAQWGPDQAGLEETSALTSLGQSLTLEQRSIVIQAIERLSDVSVGFGGQAHFAVAPISSTEEINLLDPERSFREANVTVLRADFLNEMIRSVAAERGVPFPQGFVIAFPAKAEVGLPGREKGDLIKRALVLDTSALAVLKSMPLELRNAFARREALLFTSPGLSSEGVLAKAFLVDLLSDFHEKSGHRVFAYSALPNLGMNIRRKTNNPGGSVQASVLKDVMQRHYQFRNSKAAVQRIGAFIRQYALPSRADQSPKIRALVVQIQNYFGYEADLQVNLGANLEVPLEFELADGRPQLTVDGSLLALPKKEISAVVAYSLSHMNLSNSVTLGDPLARELVAYFEGARNLLENAPNLSVLLSAMRHLDRQGWDTGAHIRYLVALDQARYDQAIERALGSTSRQYVNENNFRIALKGRLSAQGKFVAEGIVQSAYGALPKNPTPAQLHQGSSYLVPTAREVVRVMQLRPDLSPDLALRILETNRKLLLRIRVRGWEEFGFHLALWDPERLLEDLNKGSKSFVCCSVLGAGEPVKHPKTPFLEDYLREHPHTEASYDYAAYLQEHHPAAYAEYEKELKPYLETIRRYREYRSGVHPFYVFQTLMGQEGISAALKDLNWQERLGFFSGVTEKFLPAENRRKMVLRGQPVAEDFMDLLSPAVEELLLGIRDGRWSDGAEYLLQGGDPRAVMELLTFIQGVNFSALEGEFIGNQGSRLRLFDEAQHALVGRIIERWGIVLGEMVRSEAEPSRELKRFVDIYRDRFRAILANAEDQALTQKGPILEAVLLLARYLKESSSEDLLAEMRGTLDAAWPVILAVDPYDSSTQFRVERSAFRYLTTLRDPASLDFLSKGLAQYLQSKTRTVPHTYPYAKAILTAGGNPEALSTIAKYILLYEIPARDSAQRTADFASALNGYPPAVRSQVLQGMVPTPADFDQVFSRVNSPALKTYLLVNLPASLVSDHLEHIDVDRTQALFSGVDPKVIRPITDQMEQERRGLDILHRRVYERFVANFPDRVDNYREGGTLENHYTALGVPRSANAEMLGKSYRLLAFAYHPDRFATEGQEAIQRARERMKQIAESYNTLRDDALRIEYDGKIPNKAYLYPSKAWYSEIPPGTPELPEIEGVKEGSQAGLEELTSKGVRETIRKLRTGTPRQREMALDQIGRWMNPPASALIQQGELLMEALVVNLTFPTPKVREGAKSSFITAVQKQIDPKASSAEIPTIVGYLAHPKLEVRQVAWEVLTAVAKQGHRDVLPAVASTASEFLAHSDPAIRQFGQKIVLQLAQNAQTDPGLLVPLVEPTIANLSYEKEVGIREAAQNTVTAFAQRGIALETLPAAVNPTVENFRRDQSVAALGTLRAFAKAHVSPEALSGAVDLLITSLNSVIAGLHPSRSDSFRVEIFKTFGAFAENGVALNELPKTITPLLNSVGHDNAPEAQKAAQETLSAFAKAEFVPEVLATMISPSVANLTSPDYEVRKAAQRILIPLADKEALQESLLAALPTLMSYLEHLKPEIRRSVQETLLAISGREVFRRPMETAGITPADLGVQTSLNWDQLGPFIHAFNRLLMFEPYGELTLGAKAALRRILLREARSVQSVDALTDTAQAWAAHFARWEALDEKALGLSSAGAELHLPFGSQEEEQRLIEAANKMAGDVGRHDLRPSQRETADQLDVRLLPAYPTTFSRLLQLFLETPEMEKFPLVGAHYSLGGNLKGSLATLALVLFYGDSLHPWLPHPRGAADVGFPGIYTYAGATIDPRGGQLLPGDVQSNLHLRPFRVLESVPIGKGESILQPLDLFPQDLERYAWLAAAAKAPPESSLGQIFQSFKKSWYSWVEGLQKPQLLRVVQEAERAVTGRGNQGVSDALDEASVMIYEALYGISPEAVAQQQIQIPAPENLAGAAPHRQALAQLVDNTIKQIQSDLMPGQEVRQTLLAYRQAKTLEELNRIYPQAVQSVISAVFETQRHPFLEEEQLLKLLDALDHKKAVVIRRALGRMETASGSEEEAPAAGLEEVGARIAAASTRYKGFFKNGTELADNQVIPHLNNVAGRKTTLEIDLNQLSDIDPAAITAIGRIFTHAEDIIPTMWRTLPHETLPPVLNQVKDFLAEKNAGGMDLALVDPRIVGDAVGEWGKVLESRKTPGIVMTPAVLSALNNLKSAQDLAIVLTAIRQAGGIVLGFEIEERAGQRKLYLYA